MVEDRKNCFAWVNEYTCYALKNKECTNCSFYKENVDRHKVEKEIARYKATFSGKE